MAIDFNQVKVLTDAIESLRRYHIYRPLLLEAMKQLQAINDTLPPEQLAPNLPPVQPAQPQLR